MIEYHKHPSGYSILDSATYTPDPWYCRKIKSRLWELYYTCNGVKLVVARYTCPKDAIDRASKKGVEVKVLK